MDGQSLDLKIEDGVMDQCDIHDDALVLKFLRISMVQKSKIVICNGQRDTDWRNYMFSKCGSTQSSYAEYEKYSAYEVAHRV